MKYGVVVLALFSSSLALAATVTCTDPSGKWQYSTYAQEGGPCCGRSSAKLSYAGVALKETQSINSPVDGVSNTDSNPKLTVAEGAHTDLNNSVVEPAQNLKITHFAMNLAIATADGSATLPGSASKAVVSLVCEDDSYLYPVP